MTCSAVHDAAEGMGAVHDAAESHGSQHGDFEVRSVQDTAEKSEEQKKYLKEQMFLLEMELTDEHNANDELMELQADYDDKCSALHAMQNKVRSNLFLLCNTLRCSSHVLSRPDVQTHCHDLPVPVTPLHPGPVTIACGSGCDVRSE